MSLHVSEGGAPCLPWTRALQHRLGSITTAFFPEYVSTCPIHSATTCLVTTQESGPTSLGLSLSGFSTSILTVPQLSIS